MEFLCNNVPVSPNLLKNSSKILVNLPKIKFSISPMSAAGLLGLNLVSINSPSTTQSWRPSGTKAASPLAKGESFKPISYDIVFQEATSFVIYICLLWACFSCLSLHNHITIVNERVSTVFWPKIFRQTYPSITSFVVGKKA